MNREGHNDVKFFVGAEVERSPALGSWTLFVVGIQSVVDIINWAERNKCRHIYFGANQSYAPKGDDPQMWDHMILSILRNYPQFYVTLDFDVKYLETVLEGGYTEHHQFIPMVSVKLPYIGQLGYNAVIKLDDRDFAATNPGVWCHPLTSLTTENAMTRWADYQGDTTIE